MKNVNLFGKRVVWFSLLSVFVAGAALVAAEGGMMSKDDLKTHMTGATSAADHEALARHFDAKADELEAESKDHAVLAEQYKMHPTIHEMKHQMSGETASHCRYFATELHKSSLAARQMATDHRAMGKESFK